MKFHILPAYLHYKSELQNILGRFESDGTLVGNGNRNTIKYFDLDGFKINIKSFKRPNVVNQLVYKYFRKSKARRSYEYANLLIANGFNTPEPIAFVEHHTFFGMTSSYYICKHLTAISTMRDVITDTFFKDRATILKGYAQYFFRLHEMGIEFIDNSSANILIDQQGDAYRYYLVDLNRMNFHQQMEWQTRLHNFGRLTADQEVLRIISEEYAQLANVPVDQVYPEIEKSAEAFRQNFKTKKRLKSIIKF